jgi:UDP-N-acetylglucosamine 2-epimerase
MIQVGLPIDKIVVTGQPYFDWLSNNFATESKKSSAAMKKIIFVSEPISQSYRNYLGYTEKTIFNELTSALNEISLKNKIKITVLIKPHPREHSDYFINFVKNNKSENLSFQVVQQSNFLDLINQADIICGMSSMALLEAVILKKNVISIQIGLKRESPFILDVLGALKSVRRQCDLVLALAAVLIDKSKVQCDFDFVPNAIKNVVAQIEDIFHGDEQNKRSSINKNNASSCN